MRAIRIVATAGLIAVLAVCLAGSPVNVGASPASFPTHNHSRLTSYSNSAYDFSDDAYDIEAYNTYCPSGGTACVANSGATVDSECYYNGYICPGLRYADAESYGFFNGATSGTPAAVYVECDLNTNYGWEASYAYPTSDPTDYSTSHSGVISGKSTLVDWYPAANSYGGEGNPAQVSSQNFSAYDSTFQTRATVSGIQNTNNQDDTLNAGSMSISMYGRIYTYNGYGQTLQISGNEQQDSSGHYYYVGAVSCTAGGSHTHDLANAGYSPYSENYWRYEGEMESVIANEQSEGKD